jgi:hypothetical protein
MSDDNNGFYLPMQNIDDDVIVKILLSNIRKKSIVNKNDEIYPNFYADNCLKYSFDNDIN